MSVWLKHISVMASENKHCVFLFIIIKQDLYKLFALWTLSISKKFPHWDPPLSLQYDVADQIRIVCVVQYAPPSPLYSVCFSFCKGVLLRGSLNVSTEEKESDARFIRRRLERDRGETGTLPAQSPARPQGLG